jgi:hypothetical protein
MSFFLQDSWNRWTVEKNQIARGAKELGADPKIKTELGGD